MSSLKNWLGVETYRAMMLVIIGGVVGGVGAVLLMYLREEPGYVLPAVKVQIATVIIGPIAALIAVLFILNTDRRDTLRLLLLAIICGLSGPAVVVTGANIGLRLIDEAPLAWDYSNGKLVQRPGADK